MLTLFKQVAAILLSIHGLNLKEVMAYLVQMEKMGRPATFTSNTLMTGKPSPLIMVRLPVYTWVYM